MIPRLIPITTACVRSSVPSLDRMLLTWLLIASSVMESLGGDLLVRVTVRDQAQHAHLQRRQGFLGGVIRQVERHFRRECLSACMYGPDRGEHLVDQRALQQVSARSGLDCAQHLHVPRVGCQHDDARVRELRTYRRHGLDAIHLRHLQVHERHVWPVPAKLVDRLTAVRRFCHQRHARLVGDLAGNALTYQLMIVDDKNADGAGFVTHLVVVSPVSRASRFQDAEASRCRNSRCQNDRCGGESA